MSVQRLSLSLKSLFDKTFGDLNQFIRSRDWLFFWQMHYVAKWLPLLLGVMSGVILARYIINFDDTWVAVITIAFLVPMIILFSRYPFVAIMIWLLVIPFVLNTPTAAYRSAYWLIHRAVIPAALIAAVLANLMKVNQRPIVKPGRADLAMIVSMGLLLMSVFVNHTDPLPMLYAVYDRFFVAFCVYWLICFASPSEKDVKQLLPIAFIIVLAECVIGLMSWFAPQLLPAHWLGRLQGERTVGSFQSYSTYTICLASLSLLLFQSAVNRRPGLIRIAYLFAFGFSAIGTFLSFSRGSWLAGLIIMLGLLFIYPKVTLQMAAIVFVVMAILAGGFMANQITWANERLNDEDTAYDRLVFMHAAWEMVKTKPFFGWGYETYDRYDRQFQTRVANYVVSKDNTSHNAHLTVLAERGMVGFFFYHFPTLWWLLLTFRVWPRLPKEGFWSRKLLIMFWLMILYQIIVANFTDTKRDPFAFTMWWMTLGFIANIVYAYLKPGDIGSPAHSALKSL